MESAMREGIARAAKTVSFMVTLKGIVGCALFACALFGVAVPHIFGVQPTVIGEGAAATVGGLVGAIASLRG